MQINNCLVIIKQTAMAQGGRAATFAHKGDETAERLLRASQFVRCGMVIGVNSAPGDSVGRFCTANRENFAERLDAIRLAGDGCRCARATSNSWRASFTANLIASTN